MERKSHIPKKDLVMPSGIQNLRDTEAYLKIANYPVTKINFTYKKLLYRHEPFISRILLRIKFPLHF